MKLFGKKVFELGSGTVTRYTIIEIRWLFSIYVHRIDTEFQDRFHTHAFNALAFLFKGGYVEEVQDGIGGGKTWLRTVKRGFRYIPRMYNHKILKAAPGTTTLLLAGPYSELWTEETDDWVRLITKGSKEVIRFKKHTQCKT